MASLHTYVSQLWERQKAIAIKLGADISRADKTTRVLNKSLLVLLAVVIKALTDKSVLTDAELLAALNSARDDGYDDEPIQPPISPP